VGLTRDMWAYFEVLVRWKWVVLLVTALSCAVVTIATLLMPPTYVASATLRVVASATSGSMEDVDYKYTDRLVNTYVAILESRPILEQAIARLDLNMMPGSLAGKTDVQALPDTELIRINVEDGDPALAKDIANTLAALLIEQSASLYSGGGKSARQILEERLSAIESELQDDRLRLYSLMNSGANNYGEIDALNSKIMLEEQSYAMLLTQYEQARIEEAMRANSIAVVEPAIEPGRPSKPSTKLNIILGALVGLGGGIGLAFLFENLRGTPAAQWLPSLGKSTSGEEAQVGGERVPVSVEELGLEASIARILREAGIESAEDLLKKDEEELLAIPGFGAKTLEQLRASLDRKGFTWR
jgi:uncharacterized protein involved in exopolysaccharide biosynthesis